MQILKHSRLYRGGVTAACLRDEMTECRFAINEDDRCIDIRFDIASKGGGITSVLLQLAVNDLHGLLQALATSLPEVGRALSAGATTAIKRSCQILNETRREQASAKIRVAKTLKRLEAIGEFIADSASVANAGTDARATEAYRHLEESISELCVNT